MTAKINTIIIIDLQQQLILNSGFSMAWALEKYTSGATVWTLEIL
jgi:hypothetical protein